MAGPKPKVKLKKAEAFTTPFKDGKVAKPMIGKAKLVKPGPSLPQPKPSKKQQYVDDQYHHRPLKLYKQSTQAPVLKILQQTTRPVHAIAGGVDAAITHKPVLKAVKKGFSDVNAPGFSKVLKDAGAPKIVQKVGGFALDVGADPTTYLTFGAGSVAKKAAVSAAEATAKKAARAGMTEAGAATVVKQAGKKAALKAKPGKGLVVKFAGKEAPGVRRATARVPKPSVRAPEALREVRPTLAPAGADKGQYAAVRQAARQSRAARTRGASIAEGQATFLAKHVPVKDHARVVDAIEKRQISKLPGHPDDPTTLAGAARALRDQQRHSLKLRKQSGLLGDVGKIKAPGAAKGYFPHAQDTPLKQGLGIVERDQQDEIKQAFGGATRKDAAAKGRQEKRPISAVNPGRVAEGKDPFSTNIPLVHLNYQRSTAKIAASARLEKNIAAAGRPVRPGKIPELRAGEKVFHLGYQGKGSVFKLREVDLKKPLPKSGQFTALDPRNVNAARQYGKATQAESSIGRGVDKVTRGFKGLATFTPGFHARNAVGDTWLAYMNQSGLKLPRNVVQGVKASRALGNRRKAIESFAKDTANDGKTLKIAGKRTPIRSFLDLAEKHGVTQSGYIGGELRDLAADTSKQGVGRLHKTPRLSKVPVVSAMTTGRENAIRLATFKDGLDKGMSPVQAAEHSLGPHIDYADLTRVERQYLRRLMPFYTFSARALPFQAKKLVTNPGKFATLEKAREDLGETKDVSSFSTYTQRNVPIVIGGKAVTDSLPVNLLNELPADPKHWPKELFQFTAGLTNPVIKDPVEFFSNHTFNFRDTIQDPKKPLVPAPDWVGKLPGPARAHLGVTKILDRKSGKMVWGWPGKTDYAVKAVMLGPLNLVNQVTSTGTNRQGQGTVAKIVAGVGGVKITPPDKATQDINRLFTKLNQLTEQQGRLNQQGVKAGNATPAYREITGQIKRLERQIYVASRKRGDRVPPFGPRSSSGPKGLGSTLGGSGLGGSLGGGLSP